MKPADIGARHAAEPAEHDDREGREDEVAADVGRERVDRCEQRARNAGERGAEREGQQIRALDIDAHQPRGLAILDHGADRLAGHGAREEQHQAERDAGHRDEHDHARDACPQAEQLDHAARIGAGEAVAFAARDRQHGVLEQDEQAEGGEDLHHRLVLQRLQHEPLHHEPDDEHQRRDQKHRVVRADSELREAEEGRIHGDHHELALGEIDDAHDAEDQVQPDADEAVDPAEQDAGDQDVEERFHQPGAASRARNAGPAGCTLATCAAG